MLIKAAGDERGLLRSDAHICSRSLEKLNEQIAELEEWLKKKADDDAVQLLLYAERRRLSDGTCDRSHTRRCITLSESCRSRSRALPGSIPWRIECRTRSGSDSISKAGSPLLRYQLGLAAQIAAGQMPN